MDQFSVFDPHQNVLVPVRRGDAHVVKLGSVVGVIVHGKPHPEFERVAVEVLDVALPTLHRADVTQETLARVVHAAALWVLESVCTPDRVGHGPGEQSEERLGLVFDSFHDDLLHRGCPVDDDARQMRAGHHRIGDVRLVPLRPTAQAAVLRPRQ